MLYSTCHVWPQFLISWLSNDSQARLLHLTQTSDDHLWSDIHTGFYPTTSVPLLITYGRTFASFCTPPREWATSCLSDSKKGQSCPSFLIFFFLRVVALSFKTPPWDGTVSVKKAWAVSTLATQSAAPSVNNWRMHSCVALPMLIRVPAPSGEAFQVYMGIFASLQRDMNCKK